MYPCATIRQTYKDRGSPLSFPLLVSPYSLLDRSSSYFLPVYILKPPRSLVSACQHMRVEYSLIFSAFALWCKQIIPFFNLIGSLPVWTRKGFSAPKLTTTCDSFERFPILVIYAFGGRGRVSLVLNWDQKWECWKAKEWLVKFGKTMPCNDSVVKRNVYWIALRLIVGRVEQSQPHVTAYRVWWTTTTQSHAHTTLRSDPWSFYYTRISPPYLWKVHKKWSLHS